MIEKLRFAVKALRAVLNEEQMSAWKSLYIDYEKPHVERLWTTINVPRYYPATPGYEEHRLYLHRIHPCETKEALYHPHPWPSAMLVGGEGYEMGVGYGLPYFPPPPIIGPFFLGGWSAYQMLSPNDWHYVRPIKICYSLMITGPLFDPHAVKKDKPKMRPLTWAEGTRLFEVFGKKENQVGMLEVLDKYLKEKTCPTV